MSSDHESGSPSDATLRKRVTKACDRCRAKKSKCDGAVPCSRCKADDQICNFGERRKSAEKVHPKGYAEALELNVEQLRRGVVKLYKILDQAGLWPEEPVKGASEGGMPPLHHILDRVGALKKGEWHDHDLSSIRSRLEQQQQQNQHQHQHHHHQQQQQQRTRLQKPHVTEAPPREDSFDSASSRDSNLNSTTSSHDSTFWPSPPIFTSPFHQQAPTTHAWLQGTAAPSDTTRFKDVPQPATVYNEWKRYSVTFAEGFNTGAIRLQDPPGLHGPSTMEDLLVRNDLNLMDDNMYHPNPRLMRHTDYDPMMTESVLFEPESYHGF